jgi:hypothetical protein
VHASELGLLHAEDDEILRVALTEERVIVSEDADFGALLARAGARSPSFVLIRSAALPRLFDESRGPAASRSCNEHVCAFNHSRSREKIVLIRASSGDQ